MSQPRDFPRCRSPDRSVNSSDADDVPSCVPQYRKASSRQQCSRHGLTLRTASERGFGGCDKSPAIVAALTAGSSRCCCPAGASSADQACVLPLRCKEVMCVGKAHDGAQANGRLLGHPLNIASMNRNLWLLAICQGLFLTNNVTFIAINGLVGLALAPASWMATVPVMGYVVGGALSTGMVRPHPRRVRAQGRVPTGPAGGDRLLAAVLLCRVQPEFLAAVCSHGDCGLLQRQCRAVSVRSRRVGPAGCTGESRLPGDGGWSARGRGGAESGVLHARLVPGAVRRGLRGAGVRCVVVAGPCFR